MIVATPCHTSEHSACSHVAAVDLVHRAYEAGVQTIVLTDHHYQWSEDELADLRRRAGLPPEFQILPGQEVDTYDFGHVLVYGAGATIPAMKISLLHVREQHPDAAVIWSHPYRDKRIPAPERLVDPLLDGVEILNSDYTVLEAARALKDWHTYRFTATAGTDTHGQSYVGAYPTLFDHPFGSIEEMVAEIQAGRCRPYFKEIPILSGTSSTHVTEVTLGPDEAPTSRKVIVKTFDDVAAWSQGERSYHIVQELYRHGFNEGEYRVAKPIDEDPYSLSLIEEYVGGQSLFDAMVQAQPAQAIRYLQMAARWLAKLHNAQLQITPVDEYLQIGPDRLEYYLKSLIETHNRHLGRARRSRRTDDMKKNIEEIARETGRYSPAAFRFVYDGLGFTVQNIAKEPRHVSGQTLCEGLRRMASEKYGRLALLVLNSWGLRTTRDFGEIVYTLIDYEWMSAQPTDTIDDFNAVYDFRVALKDQFQFWRPRNQQYLSEPGDATGSGRPSGTRRTRRGQ
ncbi:MAG: phosphotransferase [Planctomycetes bacterium]|nr:phosphotransferase [Planctomycetota bacterium]